MTKFNDQFWVSNVSNMNVSLTDLGLTIPAGRTVNLMDRRHYFFEREQLVSSASEGSLFKKRNKVVVRKVPPVVETKKMLAIEYNATVPSRRRSGIQITEVHYDELDISDEVYAAEAADLVDQNK